MAPVRHLSTVELAVWAITSNIKTGTWRHLHGSSGLISTMFHFPCVFLLGAGSWAKPPAEDGAGRPCNLRAWWLIPVLGECCVRLTGFVLLRAESFIRVLVRRFDGVSGFLAGTAVLLFLCFSAWISWSFWNASCLTWNAGCLAFLWWWSYSAALLFGEESVAILLSLRCCRRGKGRCRCGEGLASCGEGGGGRRPSMACNR